MPPDYCPWDFAQKEESPVVALELAFEEAPIPRKERDEDECKGGVYVKRRWETANTRCGRVLLG